MKKIKLNTSFSFAERTEDPVESYIEAEGKQDYQRSDNNPELASPFDQERKFVGLLKKHYQGSFPEYTKETKADYARNRELDDNLNAQPETVFFGHTDVYNGKPGKNEVTSEFPIPDDIPPVDSLDAFDTDSTALNPDIQHTKQTENFHTEIKNPARASSHTTAPHYTVEPTEDGEIQLNYDEDNNIKNDNTENRPFGVSGFTQDDDDADNEGAQGILGVGEEQSGTDEGQDEASGTNKVVLEHETTEDEKKEEALSDTTVKASQKLLRYKEKNKKEKSKEKDNSADILKEFDELKGNKSTKGKPIGKGEDSDGSSKITDGKESQKLRTGNNINAKRVDDINEDSKDTGDAILDFLDKLLEKDPKKLRHDVLAVAKEMKNEETNSNVGKTATLANEKEISAPGQPSNTRKPHKKLTKGSFKNVYNKVKEIDKWISEMEDKINDEKEAVVDQTGNDEAYENEEYDEFRSPPEIYPDNNGGEAASSEPEYNGVDAGTQSKAEESNGKTEQAKQRKQDEFDYGKKNTWKQK